MQGDIFSCVKTSGQSQNPAIVFLHGGGLSSTAWQPQLASLSDAFYCVAPDLPEQGQSVGLKPFTLEDTGQRVAKLIRTLPSQKAHVVGLSLGGAVALEVARTAPDTVDYVMISGASAGMSGWLGQLAIASSAMYRWFKPETLVNMSYKQFNIPEVYRAGLREDLIKGFDPAFTRHFIQALTQLQLPKRASMLVTVGERETLVAKRDARKLARSIQGARGAMVIGVGHVWNLEAAELFTQTVRAFVTNAALPRELRAF